MYAERLTRKIMQWIARKPS